MNVFAYYNKSGRLIRVSERTLNHFQDITPNSLYPVKSDKLKASYLAWRDADKDDGSWQLIGTYDFFIDNDAVAKIIQNFKGVADYRNPVKRSQISDEIKAEIKRRSALGESSYSIAKTLKVDAKTVRRHRGM